jgi:hypothetical protein
MSEPAVVRVDVIEALHRALEPLEFLYAMWEAGAAAFGRVDEWSDLDLQVICDDDRVEETFEAAVGALKRVSPIDLTFRFPEPTWHGHSQAFYRLAKASEFLLVDFVVMKRGGSSDRFMQPEIHGRPVVYFDKKGDVTWEPLDARAFAERLRGRVATVRSLFGLFSPFVLKELNRGNGVEAMAYYQSVVLRPLVELLRIAHAPVRHNFYARYVHYDLPGAVAERLERLFYAGAAEELSEKCREAAVWFAELVDEVQDGPTESDIADAIGRERGVSL